MWYSDLGRTQFLINLYENVPELKNVRIGEISIQDEGQIVAISFDMPFFADKTPEKWIEQRYNRVFVRMDFSAIRELSIKSDSSDYRGNIEVIKNELELLEIKITGTLDAFIKAESGFIHSVSGYIDENTP